MHQKSIKYTKIYHFDTEKLKYIPCNVMTELMNLHEWEYMIDWIVNNFHYGLHHSYYA